MKFYEIKISIGVVYRMIPWQKRLLHNLMIPLVLGIIAWPAMEVALHLNSPPANLAFKIFRFGVFASVGVGLMYLMLRIYFRDFASAIKKSKKFSRFYINRGKVDYEAHREWQRKKILKTLEKDGYIAKEDFQELYEQLGEWMKKERFSLILYATLFASIGIPVWAAYLTTVFSGDMTFEQGTILFIAFCIIACVMCFGVKICNELYNTVLTKHNRIATAREVLGNTILRYNKIKVTMNTKGEKRLAA